MTTAPSIAGASARPDAAALSAQEARAWARWSREGRGARADDPLAAALGQLLRERVRAREAGAPEVEGCGVEDVRRLLELRLAHLVRGWCEELDELGLEEGAGDPRREDSDEGARPHARTAGAEHDRALARLELGGFLLAQRARAAGLRVPAALRSRAHRLRARPRPARGRSWSSALRDLAAESLSLSYDLPPATAARELAHVRALLAVEERRGTAVDDPLAGLARRRRRVRAEAQERRLQVQLERRFGARAVATWERTMAGAILLLLVLMPVHYLLPAQLGPFGNGTRLLRFDLGVLDGLCCTLLLWDFLFKAYLVRFSVLWLRRHVWTDFLPSIPVGFLHAGLMLRLARLGRVMRYLRVLLPVVRAGQALGFLSRGLDRLVRQHAAALDRELVLFPTALEVREARGRAARTGPAEELAASARAWRRAAEGADAAGRAALLRARAECLAAAVALPHPRPGSPGGEPTGTTRPRMVAQVALEQAARVEPEALEAALGSGTTERAARALRALAGSPLGVLPLLSWVPRAWEDEGAAGYLSRALAAFAVRARRAQRAVHAVADLHGVVTPAELVGRVGQTLVKRTARPAGRLVLLGVTLGLLRLLVGLVDLPALQDWSDALARTLGTALVVLGAVCLVLLAVGLWLQRLASDASSFLGRVSSAQYLHLLDSVKARRRAPDAEALELRVLAPERRQAARGPEMEPGAETPAEAEVPAPTAVASAAESDAAASHPVETTLDPVLCTWLLDGRLPAAGPLAQVALMYRDHSDGPLLGAGDTRIPSQLLGNLALTRFLSDAGRMTRADHRALASLDLLHRPLIPGGPYLWFHAITQALAEGAARRIVDYAEHGLPRAQLERAEPAVRARHDAWLATRLRHPERPPEPPPRGRRHDPSSSAFTTLHFLDDDPARDAEVGRRFGPEVLDLLRRDRRALYRRVFGSWPLERLPRESRVLNLRALHREWLEGGRALFLLPRLSLRALGRTGTALGVVVEAVRQVRDPARAFLRDAPPPAGFEAAERKLQRMRGAVGEALVELRARFDVEFLGLALPGCGPPDPGAATCEEDLRFLAADPRLGQRVERERKAARQDLDLLEALLASGDPEVPEVPEAGRRSVVQALRADLLGLRSHLFGPELLRRELLAPSRPAPRGAAPRGLGLPWGRRARAFRRWWNEHGTPDRVARARAQARLAADPRGLGAALEVWASLGEAGARATGLELLRDVLRHPEPLDEALLALRTLQTLSLLDLFAYREHVWRLGGYGEDGVPPPEPAGTGRDPREATPESGSTGTGARADAPAEGRPVGQAEPDSSASARTSSSRAT